MNEIFEKCGWANPKALASEAGPSTSQVPFSSKNENIKEKNKKRKVDVLDDILEKMKDKQIKREKEKKENKTSLRYSCNKRQNNMKKRWL